MTRYKSEIDELRNLFSHFELSSEFDALFSLCAVALLARNEDGHKERWTDSAVFALVQDSSYDRFTKDYLLKSLGFGLDGASDLPFNHLIDTLDKDWGFSEHFILDIEAEIVATPKYIGPSQCLIPFLYRHFKFGQNKKLLVLSDSPGTLMSMMGECAKEKSVEIACEFAEDAARAQIRSGLLSGLAEIDTTPWDELSMNDGEFVYIDFLSKWAHAVSSRAKSAMRYNAGAEKSPSDLRSLVGLMERLVFGNPCGSLNPSRKVCLVPQSFMVSPAFKTIWKKAIEEDFLETVIQLPEGLYGGYSGEFGLIIFDTSEGSVCFEDASACFKTPRRGRTFGRWLVESTEVLPEVPMEQTVEVSFSKLEENGYDIVPGQYLNELTPVKNGIRLSECASIFRGPSIAAGELDELLAEEKTPFRYLEVKNLSENGLDIDATSYLKTFPEKLKKRMLRNGDIVLPIHGRSPKERMFIGIVEGLVEDEWLCSSSNFYIVRVDQNIMDPRYVFAYLFGNDGNEQLKRIYNGKMRHVSVKRIEKLTVPMLPLEMQHLVVNRFAKARKLVEKRRQALREAEDELYEATAMSD